MLDNVIAEKKKKKEKEQIEHFYHAMLLYTLLILKQSKI